jgi:hypothetical protein
MSDTTTRRGRPRTYAQRTQISSLSIEAADLAYLDSLPGASRAAKLARIIHAYAEAIAWAHANLTGDPDTIAAATQNLTALLLR